MSHSNIPKKQGDQKNDILLSKLISLLVTAKSKNPDNPNIAFQYFYKIRELIKKGEKIGPNERKDLLHVSAMWGNIETLLMLLPLSPEEIKLTSDPAIDSGHVKIIELLLDSKMDPNLIGEEEASPLIHASLKNYDN